MARPARFFVDGSKASRIPTEVMAALPLQTREGNVTVQFVGLATTNSGVDCFFLPKGCDPSDERGNFSNAKAALRAISMYVKYRDRLGERPQAEEVGDGSSVSSVVELVRDYMENGLITRPARRYSKDGGSPDWESTFQRDPVFVDSRSRIALTTITSTVIQNDLYGRLASIHKWVLEMIRERHGWWLDFDPPPAAQGMPVWTEADAVDVLEQAVRGHLSERDRTTVYLLKGYLRPQTAKQAGTHLFGMVDFSRVWEWMLEKTARNVIYDWKAVMPKIAYTDAAGTAVAVARTLIPDFVVDTGTDCAVVDAKYYAADGRSTLPGADDIMKQHFYQMALQVHYGQSKRLKNYFVFPGSETGVGQIASAGLVGASGLLAQAMPPIKCVQVSSSQLMHACVSGEFYAALDDLLATPPTAE